MKKRSFLDVSSALSIPGATFLKQHIAYKSLVSQLPESPRVLEIGCGYGRSTWAWLDVLPKNTSYYILDNFKLQTHTLRSWDRSSGFAKRAIKLKMSQREIFDAVIKKHSNESFIKQVWHMNEVEWINSEDFTTDWDLVYTDGDHCYDAVKRVLELFRNVKIVCGDDYSDSWRGVVKAVEEYSANNLCTKEIMPGALFVIKNT